MTTEKFKELEKLLDELRGHLGYDYCVLPNHIQDGYYIGLFNKKGDCFADGSWATLEEAAKKAIHDAKK